MLPLLVVTLGLVAIGVPLWLCRKYAPLPAVTPAVALRYSLQCCIMLLCGLLALRDPLLVKWAPLVLGASVLFSIALVVVVWGELCQN